MGKSRKSKFTESGIDKDHLEEPPQKKAKLKDKCSKKLKEFPSYTSEDQKSLITLNLEAHCGVGGQRQQIGQLNICDVQDLILFAVLGRWRKAKPNWITFNSKKDFKKVIFVLVSAVGENDFNDHQNCFTNVKSLFPVRCPVSSLGKKQDREEPHKKLMRVPLSNREINRRKWKAKSTGTSGMAETFTHGRSHYLLTHEQLIANSFPMMDTLEDNSEYVYIKNSMGDKVQQDGSPMFAIDCEMCLTSRGSELTRVSVVDEHCNLVYDSLVVPERPITDYLTRFSGITADTLKGVKTTLKKVQKKLLKILPPDAILVGHSLDFDLRALKLCHDKVIDTSLIYRKTDKDESANRYFKPALRQLAYTYLGKKIQGGDDGHCSIEDARVSMELVQLKIKNGPDFGLPRKVGSTERLMDLMERSNGKPNSCSMLDSPTLVSMFAAPTTHALPCASDSEVLAQAESQIKKSDFIWIQLHDVEVLYKERRQSDTGVDHGSLAFQEALSRLDDNLKKIVSFTPSDCLVAVLFGYSDFSEVKRQKNLNSDPDIELEEAIKQAKKGLLFIKLTRVLTFSSPTTFQPMLLP